MTDRNVAGSNNSDLTEMNRSAIVRILQQKVCSRADIARMTGLTQASVTKITAVLIEMGIVSEIGILKGNGNRRSIGLRLNAEDKLVIGIKFSRQMFTIGVFDISGRIYKIRQTEFELTQDPGKVIGMMKKQIHDLLKKNPNAVAVGMAVPGPFFREKGRIAVITDLPGWRDVNFVSEFSDEFDKPVFIEQDANAGAMAEWWFGDHNRPVATLAYLLAGEGIGSGVVDNGNLLLGTKGVASEIGHMSVNVNGPRCECGNYGCLELYCSATQMIKRVKKEIPELLNEKFKNRSEACDAVFDAARNGNKKAIGIVNEMGRYLGYGCINIMNAYNPELIVIGDIMAKGGDLFMPVIMETVKERVFPEIYDNVRIEISKLGVDSTLLGAAAIATDKVLRKPSEYLAIN